MKTESKPVKTRTEVSFCPWCKYEGRQYFFSSFDAKCEAPPNKSPSGGTMQTFVMNSLGDCTYFYPSFWTRLLRFFGGRPAFHESQLVQIRLK